MSGRVPLYAPNGIVVASRAWSAQAGIDVLQNGATAADACIAALGVDLALGWRDNPTVLTVAVTLPPHDAVHHLRVQGSVDDLLATAQAILGLFGYRSLYDLLRYGAAYVGDGEQSAPMNDSFTRTEFMHRGRPFDWHVGKFSESDGRQLWSLEIEPPSGVGSARHGPIRAAGIGEAAVASRTIAVDHRGMVVMSCLEPEGSTMSRGWLGLLTSPQRVIILSAMRLLVPRSDVDIPNATRGLNNIIWVETGDPISAAADAAAGSSENSAPAELDGSVTCVEIDRENGLLVDLSGRAPGVHVAAY
ncbi:MAG TPA: hypothetical protein VG815_18925 [Chloroflexota bacterium]|nr:hypothetical protein [Chloroflexota bacterium]